MLHPLQLQKPGQALLKVLRGFHEQRNRQQLVSGALLLQLPFKRSASTEANGYAGLDSQEFKARMRQVLMLVHPDKFNNHPQAQKVNEQSFKALHAYMESLRSHGSSSAQLYHLEFHAWLPRSMPYQSDATNNTSVSPPAQHDPSYWQPNSTPNDAEISDGTNGAHGSDEDDDSDDGLLMKVAVRSSFGHLFSGLGVGNLFSNDQDLKGTLRVDRLRYFLPDAIEVARQSEATHYSLPAQQLQSMRTAFSHARGIKVVFDGDLNNTHSAHQMQFLEVLAQAMDLAVSAQVEDCTIVIGEGSGLDSAGRLWVHQDDGKLDWCRTLQTVDMRKVQERTSLVQSVRSTEDAVAKLLGVARIFAGERFTLSSLYMNFLQELATSARTHGPLMKGSNNGVSLCVYPPAELDALESVMHTGVIKVRTTEDLSNLYDYVALHGPFMAKSIRDNAAVESDLRDLGMRVERSLRIKTLLRDGGLSQEEFKSGCYRLLRYRAVLCDYVEGTRVRVSRCNAIQTGSTVVDIAYDFDM